MTFWTGNFYPAFSLGNTNLLFTAGAFIDVVPFSLVYRIFTFTKKTTKPILIGQISVIFPVPFIIVS